MSFFDITVEKIKTVTKHPNADRLSIYTLEGIDFQFIAGLDEFKPGDDVVYIPLDSLLPGWLMSKLGVYRKLAGTNMNRVKTINLRGCISQGLVTSIDLVKDHLDRVIKEGTEKESLASYLGITKYEPPEVWINGGIVAKHPENIVTYDLEGFERHPEAYKTLKEMDVVITEKLEGTNWYCGVLPDGTGVTGKGSNSIIEFGDKVSTYWSVARKSGILEKAKKIQETLFPGLLVIFRGEICGPGIQHNIYALKDFQVYVFDLFVDKSYLSFSMFKSICDDYQIQMVPIIKSNVNFKSWLNGRTVKEASNGQSQLSDHLREGIVVKPMTETNYLNLPSSRLVLKQKDPIYLGKEQE